MLALRRRGGVRCGAFLVVVLWVVAAPAQEEECRLAAEQGVIRFQVDGLSDPDRCRISEVIAHYSTSGTIGPRATPIGWELYEFLVDHPSLTASLVRQAELAKYEISMREENTWWANDGEGTQGLATLTYKDQTTRIYYMEGFHDGLLFGRVYADAVLFMRARPKEGECSVETNLVVYTRLDKRHWVLNTLTAIVRPLIARTVTRIVGKAFTVAHVLGNLIAEDPDQVARTAASLPSLDSGDLQTLTSLLHATVRINTPPRHVPGSP